MTPLEAAVHEVAAFLESNGVPYMIIGGVANLVWGVPRATADVDATVWVAEEETGDFLRKAQARFAILVEDPAEFVGRTRVLPVRTRAGIRADLVLGLLPIEEEAIRRATAVEFAGRPVRVCSAEDLVLHKILSERPRDRDDVRGIGRPEILESYRDALGAAEKSGGIADRRKRARRG